MGSIDLIADLSISIDKKWARDGNQIFLIPEWFDFTTTHMWVQVHSVAMLGTLVEKLCKWWIYFLYQIPLHEGWNGCPPCPLKSGFSLPRSSKNTHLDAAQMWANLSDFCYKCEAGSHNCLAPLTILTYQNNSFGRAVPSISLHIIEPIHNSHWTQNPPPWRLIARSLQP